MITHAWWGLYPERPLVSSSRRCRHSPFWVICIPVSRTRNFMKLLTSAGISLTLAVGLS